MRYGVPDPSTTNLSAWPCDSALQLDKIAKLEIHVHHIPSSADVTLKCPPKQAVCSIENVVIYVPNSKLMNAGYSAEKYAADIGPFLEDVGRWAGNMTDFEKLGVQAKSEVVSHPAGWWYSVVISTFKPWVPRQDILEILPQEAFSSDKTRLLLHRESFMVVVEADNSDSCLYHSCRDRKSD